MKSMQHVDGKHKSGETQTINRGSQYMDLSSLQVEGVIPPLSYGKEPGQAQKKYANQMTSVNDADLMMVNQYHHERFMKDTSLSPR